MLNENKDNFSLNKMLLNLDVYASKAISLEAKNNPEIINLSFGEPVFGPPAYSLNDISIHDLNLDSFLNSVKRYEESRGSLELRQAIANWYKRRYALDIDPETEIMITHGGVEAITLAILCTSEIGDVVAITDPSYMLYRRTIIALGRKPGSIQRPRGDYEYLSMFDLSNTEQSLLTKAKAIIINSPENPSGYVVDQSEWDLIGDYAQKKGLWVIHDEVYDTMAFKRKHGHIRAGNALSERTILINSFSKKFGIPGLRIGWMVAHKKVIQLASKVHDYLYLGVNIQYEKIATRLISDERNEQWLLDSANTIHQRANTALDLLGESAGFSWLRKPLGAMFLFPDVRSLYDRIPNSYKANNHFVGDAVAQYLIKERRVAVVPGSVYGAEGNNHIRMVLCTPEKEFNLGLERLNNG